MPTTFKASRTAWKNWILGTIAIVIASALILILPKDLMCFLILLGFYGALLAFSLWSLSRLQLDVDEVGIRGTISAHRFEVRWQEIVYAEILKVKGKLTSILLLTKERAWHEIPLRSLDGQAICDLVLTYLPSTCFGQDALEKVQEEDKQRILSETWPLDRTFRVKIPLAVRILLWVCVIGVVFLTGMLISGGKYEALLIILFSFPPLGLYLFHTFTRTVELDSQRITERNWLGSYAIQWSEIESIKTDKEYSTIVIEGHGKRFTCIGPFWWGGADVNEARRLFWGEFERRGIKVGKDKSFTGAILWPHASTKVSPRW